MFTGIINVWNFHLPFFPTFSSYFYTLNFCLSKKQYKVLLEYLGKFWSTDVANRLASIAWRGFDVNDNSYGFRAAYSPCVDPLSTWLWKRGSEVKKVLQIYWKSGSKKLIGWLSSLHEDFVRVKTPMGLERFEVGKSWRWAERKLLRFGWKSGSE